MYLRTVARNHFCRAPPSPPLTDQSCHIFLPIRLNEKGIFNAPPLTDQLCHGFLPTVRKRNISLNNFP
jgi:hypothetical protein